MAIEYKYGEVTLEKGNIGKEEPVVVFRAKDDTLVELLTMYYILCSRAGSPKEHLNRIAETQSKIMLWRNDNETKVPD